MKARTCTPEIKEKGGHIYNRLVHEIPCEASGEVENMRDPIENTGFCNPGIKSMPITFLVGSRGDHVEEILSILYGIRVGERVYIDVIVRGGPMVFEMERPQESWVVMRASNFVVANETTKEPTAFMAMVTDGVAELCHRHCVRQDQEQEDQRDDDLPIVGVPDAQALFLECRYMGKTRKQEGFNIPWGVWTQNDTSRKDISDLVAFFWSQIENNPDIDPAVGFFVLIKLHAVDREHENGVVFTN